MTDVVQRWLGGRASYRPAREVIDPKRLDIAPLPELDAKAFIKLHHYSRSFPAARFRFGIYDRGSLAGVAVFSRPFAAATLSNVFPDLAPRAGVELGRLVLLDELAANAETWFLARCFEQLALAGIEGVVSFSDPCERTKLDGSVIFPGHVGTIYQAQNAEYLGLTDDRTIQLLPDGTVFSNFSSGKIRRGLCGWRSAATELERWGAKPIGDRLPPKRVRIAWLNRWRDALTRSMRHRGCHRYAWGLDRILHRSIIATNRPTRANPKRGTA